jgi:hypothetical protein
MKKLKTILTILPPLLLTTLLWPLPLIAQEDFETIYPENEEATEEEKEQTQQSEPVLVTEDEENQETEMEEGEIEETIIDENTKKTQNRYFDLTLERKPQTPFGKSVPYILTITPHIDSPRTQILWNTPSTLESNPKHSEFVALESGQTYTFKGRVKPLRAGVFDFSVSVISWQHDTNYTNSISDNITFNSNLVLQPVSTHYQLLNILKFVLIALAFVGLIFLTVVLVKKYKQKAKKWLTPPDW